MSCCPSGIFPDVTVPAADPAVEADFGETEAVACGKPRFPQLRLQAFFKKRQFNI
jgi:hypothetical protein